MLLPKRVKYRRVHRGRMTGKATRGNFVSNGEFGIQALEPAWITSNQIEAARIAMTRYIKRYKWNYTGSKSCYKSDVSDKTVLNRSAKITNYSSCNASYYR